MEIKIITPAEKERFVCFFESDNEDLVHVGVRHLARLPPPLLDALDRKFSSIVVDANIDEAMIVNEIVNPLGFLDALFRLDIEDLS
ncbi:hypothetical protein KSD_12550 [Ktedonobacter sp. SOSP1-85]|nr:hypothetical protein KSD_12550 [Ktedonobacter sp. SOSP1-85]